MGRTIYVLLAYALAGLSLLGESLTQASPFTPPGTDVIVIPDIGELDNTILKERNAEKFLFSWFTRVLTVPTVTSKEPWTLLVPQNTGFPSVQEVNLDFLLRHAILGSAVVFSDVETEPQEYTSLTGTPVKFCKVDGQLHVEDIPVLGEPIMVSDGVVYILQNFIPEQKKYPDASAIEELLSNEAEPILPRAPTASRDSQSVLTTAPTAGSSRASSIEPSTASSTTAQYSSTTAEPKIETETSSFKPKNVVFVDNFDRYSKKEESVSLDLASLFSIITSTDSTKLLSSTTVTEPSTTSPTLRKKKNKQQRNKNGLRATRYEKFVYKRNKHGKGKSITSESTDPDLIDQQKANALTAAVPKTSTMTTNTISLSTEKIPIINSDTEADIMKVYEDNQDNFGLNVEFGSGDVDNTESEFNSNTFLGALKRELTGNHGTSEFLRHFDNSNLDHKFRSDSKYTCLVPSDIAFYNYYPIDWGFNPFQVPSFTRDVILNHFIQDEYKLETLKPMEAMIVTTLGGREIKFSRDVNGTILANGQEITKESDVPITSGRLYHLHQLLFVDQDRVSELKRKYPYLEKPPLMVAPWPSSQFLSHLLVHVSKDKQTGAFAEYLNTSTNIAHLAPSADENLDSQNYTAFVPIDDAIMGMLYADAPDAFSVDPTLRKNLILNSIVKGIYTTSDLVDGTILNTLAGTNLTVSVWPDGLYLNGVEVIIPESYIYNLGLVFKVEGVLGIDEQDVQDAIRDHPNAPAIWKAPLTSNASGYQDVRYETRTEVSVSQRVNDGEIVPVYESVDGDTVTVKESVAVEESVTIGEPITREHLANQQHGTTPTLDPTVTRSTNIPVTQRNALPHLRAGFVVAGGL